MKNRLLLIVHLPPPIHGASMVSEMVVRTSAIHDNFETRVMPLHFATSISDIGALSVQKVWKMIVFFFRLMIMLIRFRPHLVYYTIAPRGFAFSRDALFVSLIKIFGARLVFHLHSQGIQKSMSASRTSRWLHKFVFRNSYIICISPFLHWEFEGLNPRHIFFLPNGIKPGNYLPQKNSSADFDILFVSNLLKDKGILLFVDALKLLAETSAGFRVHIVGADGDLTQNELKEILISKGLAERVKVEGPKYGNDKLFFFNKASAFIMPSYAEVFPISILEAMDAGLPVIASDVGGVRDMVQDQQTGFVFPAGDSSALANSIRKLVENPSLADELGASGRDLFLEKFTLAAFEKSLTEILLSCAKQREV